MKDTTNNITRRRVLASSAGVATVGSLFSGSAAARRSSGQSKAKALKIKNLSDAITVANGKAKVKGWAHSPGKGEITVTTQSGQSMSYGAREFAEDINRGVEEGFWTIQIRAGELIFDLTEKGRQLISKYKNRMNLLQAQNCGGKNRIEGDIIYFDSGSLDDIVFGLQGSAGIFTIAGIIVAALTTATLGPIVFAAAAILIGLGGTRLGQIDDGCGVKVNTNTNEVLPQDCYC